MLKLLSDLKRANRMDFTAAAAVLLSGVTGTWVTKDGNDVLQMPSGATRLAFPIWTESNRDGSVGWTPDVSATGKLTVFDGYMRAVTDQTASYSSMAVGDLLKVDTSGNLLTTTDATEAVAVLMKKVGDVTVLGTTFTECIEFTTGR